MPFLSKGIFFAFFSAFLISANLAHAAPQADVDIGVRPHIFVPPDAITNLSGLAGPLEAAVNLKWTAPAMFPGVALNNYEIRYATNSIASVGSTTTWWNNAPGDYINNYPIPTFAGDSISVTLNSLTAGQTYFFAIQSFDEFDNVSQIDTLSTTTSQASAVALDLAPPMVTGLTTSVSSTTITLSWSASTATDVTSYRIYWDTSAPADLFVPTVTVTVPTLSYTFNNLTGQNTYFFYVTALDRGAPTYPGDVLESTPSAIVSTFPTETIPLAPSNLIAAAISTNSITWQWTDNANNELGFRIYSSSGGVMGQIAPAAGTGSTVQFVETNLNLNTSYARYVKAFNGTGDSLSSNTTSRYTLTNPPQGSLFSSVFVSSLSVTWQANNNPGTVFYEIQLSTNAGFAPATIQSTTTLSSTFTALNFATTYYARVRSQNGEGVKSNFDSTISAITLPGVILGLTATAGDRQVALDWQDAIVSNLAGYFVYRRTGSDPYAKQSTTPLVTSDYLDTGLTNGVTYSYQVTFITFSGQESLPVSVSARPRKSARPQSPTGIRGSIDSQGKFTLKWSAVTMDVAGSTRTELAAYRIYKSSTDEGPFDLRDFVSPSTYSWIAPDLVPPVVWYLVRAIDTSDNESDDSSLIQTIPNPPMIVGSQDGTAQITFTYQDAQQFFADSNNGSEDIRLSVNRKTSEETGTTLTAYEVKAFGAISGAPKEIKFEKPTVLMKFRYAQGIAGAPLPLRAALRTFKGSTKDVGIFWHNNVEFVKLGGVVDEFKGKVSIKTARPLGRFQVRQVPRGTEFGVTQLTPRKIFTPNGDGVNDEIILFLDNPRDSIITQAKVYDITGAEVADFQQGIVTDSVGVISLKWDGRDKSGQYVRSGIYIYQVQSEGKVINGTIVVAR